ncbi:MAG: hypothetical protein J1E40_13080 [Oscillospiraceae bacterium]|nr:hypothetical protein [Oscillospiraceae bacterium]
MATFKCKMCDAVLNVREGVSIYECEYCGTKQTIVMDSNDIAAMFGNTGHSDGGYEDSHTHAKASRGEYNKENGSVSAESLLRRAFLFLEDEDWDQAKRYCEMVLDRDPENGRAYLGKLMADVKVRHEADLAEIDVDYRPYNNFEKAIRFGDPQLVNDLKAYSIEAAYKLAVRIMDRAVLENDYRQAADQFRSVEGYKDADELAGKCDWFAKEKAAEEKKQRQEEKIKQEEELKKSKFGDISILLFMVSIGFSLFGVMATIPGSPGENNFSKVIAIIAIADILYIFYVRYLHYRMGSIKQNQYLFWFLAALSNVIASGSITFDITVMNLNDVESDWKDTFWKIMIVLVVCSLIGGFLGGKLGKAKAKKLQNNKFIKK